VYYTLNVENHLILVRSKDNTEKIDLCKYENGKWLVRYLNNSKVYQYNYLSISWYKDPKIIDHETCMVYENNLPVTDIIKILDFGDYVRLIFKSGYKKVYERSRILMEETCLRNSTAHSTFDYLKTLAGYVSIKDEGDISFLSKQYNSLKMISPRSVLTAYLERKPLTSQNRLAQAIFPFGFNISQKTATEKALTNQISVIEGPPGTGKTQTILNIIANAIVNDKTVAVVSNNNSATANVLEKLQKYGVDFIAAYLGNNDNKAKFFKEQDGTYPEISDWALSHSDHQIINTNIKASQKKLDEMLIYQNKQAVLKQELSELQTEYEYFNKYYQQSDYKPLKMRSFFQYSADRILTILHEYKRNVNRGKVPFKSKLYNLFIYGLYNFNLFKHSPEVVISFLQKTYYETKMKEINNQIEAFSKKQENYDFENAMKEYSLSSMDLFKAKLADKYGAGGSRTNFTSDALWKNFDSFIKEYPVILSTTHSLSSCTKNNYLFDYIIIDEASQVDIVTGALALSCAKNAVIVGDVMQLPNVVPSEVANTTERIFESFKMEDAYNYAHNSLLSSILKVYNNIPKTLLKEHYRCHPKIIGFCNQKFYKNELIVLTNQREEDKPLILYKTAKGNHARGKVNQRQIDVIFNEIIPGQKINEDKQSVGIISPFRLQANELKKAIAGRNIDADTVHKYQGRERDVIILTTGANEIAVNDFADNPNLINVAVSRAVNKLIVVVSEGSEEWQGTNIGDLVRYIQYNNFEIIESQIYSVFDLLYSSYSDKLLEMMKRSKKVSEYTSENLMNGVIEKVLGQPEFQQLDWVLHQPLRMLIKDPIKLTEDERKYAMNILTHTDFVIFNKLDKMPVLVVEVDGHAYHANNPTQLKRDNMKDEILRKYGIPIIRNKTTGSREEEKLREKLVGILKLETSTKELINI
jgi:superfamily I DNA and/or RNA helicase